MSPGTTSRRGRSSHQRALNLQNLRAIEIGGEHVARPVHEVVGFIDEEAVCAAILGEVTTQINLRVENVIVIADHDIDFRHAFQLQFEGADLVLLAQGAESAAARGEHAGEEFLRGGLADAAGDSDERGAK